MRDKEPAEALPLLEAATSQMPGEFRPIYYLGEAQLATGANELAQGSFQRALEINPKSSEAHLGLARALARQDKLADAAPHYREAAGLEPAFRNALLELAGFYEKENQQAEAIAIYREFPENAAARERLGALLLDSRKYAEGVARLEDAFAKDPSPSNRNLLAQAYILNHQVDKAVPLLEKSVAADPANFDLRMAYARALRDRRQFPQAAAQFDAASKLKPADARTWSELAAVLYMMGDAQPALADLDRARELGEDTPGNWFFRAMILDKLRQLKPALEAYRKFLDMSQGLHPDQEFQAKQRARVIQRELDKR